MAKHQKVTYNDVIVEITRDITEWKFMLKKLLKDCGLDVENKSFKDLLKMVEQLKVKKLNRSYRGITLDSNDYIVGIYRLSDFIDEAVLPYDVDSGYYKINKDGVLEIDYERKRQLEEV